MYIILIILILFLLVFAVSLSSKIEVLKEKVVKRDLAIEIKENQLVIANNKVQWHEQRNETTVKNLLNINNFDNLHENVEFPVAEMEDSTGMLIYRRCKNDCVIESHDYPSYDLALMASKCITELGFEMEEEYCIDCRSSSTEAFKALEESIKWNE